MSTNEFCTVHENGGITFHDDPLATALANKPKKPVVGGSCTVWMHHDDPRYYDEWARVLEMRRKSPGGLVAGGQARTPGEVVQYTGSLQRGLAHSRRAYNTKGAAAARHYSSN